MEILISQNYSYEKFHTFFSSWSQFQAREKRNAEINF